MSTKKLKLNLGCGERYLEGYHNIDFLPAMHTVQTRIVADLHQKLRLLQNELCRQTGFVLAGA